MKFEVEIFSPDGPFLEKEITEMIDFWFASQQENGKACRLLFYPDRNKRLHTCRVKLLEE